MTSLNVLMAIAASTSMGGYSTFLEQLPSKQPSIDIDHEYELIQRKESKLSANKRRWVVRQYEEKHK